MLQKVILLLIGLISIKGLAQDSKMSVELSYPLPIDNNFVGDNYNGIIDLGFKYRFLEFNTIKIGGSLNIGYLKNSKKANNQPFTVNLYPIQPRVFAELTLPSIPKFHTSLGLGYSLLLFKVANNNVALNSNVSTDIQNESGLNINTGVAYDVTEKLMIQAQYDFVNIGVDNDVPDIAYNKNINILKIGLGYRF
ncbi:outer membrane protein [Winogradskyella eximia]|uniref:outer membrane protein n=1 Tax=Winogradskyella eximia TaxID=262006 RepID=UPI0024937D56|nr:outer membrane beta-barrel protein [Winogradskyella eximia]|tara:strand:- start:15262 stop:15843 length:582 start_codon:yes stop_codon:yes gene_type:complete